MWEIKLKNGPVTFYVAKSEDLNQELMAWVANELTNNPDGVAEIRAT